MVDFLTDLNTNEWINLLSALGNWLAAFGTMTAVITAIWLARYREKEKISVYAGNRALAVIGKDPDPECFAIGITNIGSQPVTIHSASFWVGRWKNKQVAIIPQSLSFIPKTIEYGISSHITINYGEFPEWKKNLIADIIGDRPLRTLRLHITTTVGCVKKVKLEQVFLKDLKRLQEEWRIQLKSEVKKE